MHGLKKLRETLKRNKSIRNNKQPSSEIYIYTPLPNHKNGYIIEYRHSHFSEIFYYKYKENIDGSLTKYGYLVCDHYNRNFGIGKFCKNHKNVGEEIDYKSLFNNNDKECIFYQAVADKKQVALEKRWMNELREKGKLQISAYDDEWSDLMQHNNICFISHNIQRRRLAEILDNDNLYDENSFPQQSLHLRTQNVPSSCGNEDYYPLSPKTPPSSPTEDIIPQNSLLNMNIRQRDKNGDKEKNSQEEQQPKEKVRKLIHLTHPKFRKAPMVHIYEPEDTLVFKDCRCSYCIMGEYNE